MTSYQRAIRIWAVLAALSPFCAARNLTCPARPPGKDFHDQKITGANFAYQDLTNANFSNAILIAPFFGHANLTGANFQDAVIVNDNTNPTLVADFSFANLRNTCFIRAQFNGPTYLTNTSLSCTDFSETDLSNGNAIFGASPLNIDRTRTDCGVAFRASVMDCEFLADWRFLDLSGANVKACANQLTPFDFSGARLAAVDLTGANLDGMKFVRADLSQAILDHASLRGADLSYATLLGAHLNQANLANATLYHAFLSNDTGGGISNAASVRQAHLKNANLSYAQLSGVDLTYANLYGDNPAGTSICKTALSPSQCSGSGTNNYEGFTCGCASAHGAIMTQTKFSSAYVYGVDYTAARGQGVNFSQAVLTGANFNGASISTDPQSGAPSTFFRAFLQGTSLDGAQIKDAPSLSDAFVDFSIHGNNIYIVLDGANHNRFSCPDCLPPSGSDVCVLVNYPGPTRVPEGRVPLTCPSGTIGDCGPATPDGSNKNWQSRITDLGAPPAGVPPAWYETDSTYIKAPASPNVICKGKGPGSAIIFW
jgi:uncharacterized protein YjbI with pentapeptide repeats